MDLQEPGTIGPYQPAEISGVAVGVESLRYRRRVAKPAVPRADEAMKYGRDIHTVAPAQPGHQMQGGMCPMMSMIGGGMMGGGA